MIGEFGKSLFIERPGEVKLQLKTESQRLTLILSAFPLLAAAWRLLLGTEKLVDALGRQGLDKTRSLFAVSHPNESSISDLLIVI